jgi:hypothetical protein
VTTEKCFSAPPTAQGTQKKVFPPRQHRWERGEMFFHCAETVGGTEKSFSAMPTLSGAQKNVFPACRQRWEHRKIIIPFKYILK